MTSRCSKGSVKRERKEEDQQPRPSTSQQIHHQHPYFMNRNNSATARNIVTPEKDTRSVYS